MNILKTYQHSSHSNDNSIQLPSTPAGLGPPLHTSSPSNQRIQHSCTHIPKTKKTLRIVNLNCKSLKNKKAEFVSLIDSTKPDIITGTESWLSHSISDIEYFPDKFNVYRNDRSEDQRGGWVFVAVNSDLISEDEFELETDCEIIWI